MLGDKASFQWKCSSEQRDGLLAGAIIGDFHKGRINRAWPRDLVAGIRLHRRIDALSNKSESVKPTSSYYPKDLRRFAPIYFDILADHFLANNWAGWSKRALKDITSDSYYALNKFGAYIPKRNKDFVSFMQKKDLLAGYQRWDNIELAISGVMRRLGRPELSDSSIQSMSYALKKCEISFRSCLNEMIDHTADWNAFDSFRN
tara:strand:+ start:695 stop:1303 length:609 start_codon:yes stop_codon:yes gene_type:complete